MTIFSAPYAKSILHSDVMELITNAKQDLNQFQEIVELYYLDIYHFCYLYFMNQPDAIEATKNLLLEAVALFPGEDFKKEYDFDRWIFNLATKEILHIQHRNNSNAKILRPNLSSDRSIAEFSTLSKQERGIVMRELLKLMSNSCRKILIFRYYFGFSTQKISALVSMTTHAIDDQLRKCFHTMQDFIPEKINTILKEHDSYENEI